MKLVALAPLSIGGEKIAVGQEFESTQHSGAKLMARGAAALPSPKKKAKKAKPEGS